MRLPIEELEHLFLAGVFHEVIVLLKRKGCRLHFRNLLKRVITIGAAPCDVRVSTRQSQANLLGVEVQPAMFTTFFG